MPSKHAPFMPADYSEPDAFAMKALAEGVATEDQQKRALDWIINQCCKTYDLSYRPDSDRDTVFAEGKRYVGNEIIKLIKVKIGKLRHVGG